MLQSRLVALDRLLPLPAVEGAALHTSRQTVKSVCNLPYIRFSIRRGHRPSIYSRTTRSVAGASLHGRVDHSALMGSFTTMLTFQSGLSDLTCHQTDATDRIIVARNDVVDRIGVTVGVDHGNDWDANRRSLFDR